jgi:hypothetical protein
LNTNYILNKVRDQNNNLGFALNFLSLGHRLFRRMIGIEVGIKVKGEVRISKGKTHSPGPERKFTFSTNKI